MIAHTVTWFLLGVALVFGGRSEVSTVLAQRSEPRGTLLLPPETLLEPPPLNESQRLLAKARRNQRFCNVLDQLDGIEEPRPDDLRALTNYGARYAATIGGIESSIEIPEGEPNAGQRIPLPQPIDDAIRQQHAQMYAFSIRISAATRATGQRFVGNDPSSQATVNTAFLQLVNSSFTTAERILAGVHRTYCR